MAVRIITALIGLIVFFAAIFSPPVCFSLVIFAVIAIMLYEAYKSVGAGWITNVTGALSAILLMYGFYFDGAKHCVILSVMLYALATLITHGKRSVKEIFVNAIMTFYITFFMSYFITLRKEFTIYGVLFPFVISWMTDTGAYFAGVAIGKHKLIPSISPKKTVEGAIGGLVVAVLSTILYNLILTKIAPDYAIGYAFSILLGFGVSILSQIGDLFASCVKRDFEIKDFGTILPGHGGMLDRFDSVMFVTPVVYAFLHLLQYR